MRKVSHMKKLGPTTSINRTIPLRKRIEKANEEKKEETVSTEVVEE